MLSKKTLYCTYPSGEVLPTASCATLQDEPDTIMRLFCEDCPYLQKEVAGDA